MKVRSRYCPMFEWCTEHLMKYDNLLAERDRLKAENALIFMREAMLVNALKESLDEAKQLKVENAALLKVAEMVIKISDAETSSVGDTLEMVFAAAAAVKKSKGGKAS